MQLSRVALAIGALAFSAASAIAVDYPTTSYPQSDPAAIPGDAVSVVTVPVPSPSGIGVSVAADCSGNIYYTNYQSPFLHKMTSAGVLIETKALTDAATGASITLGEMAWDQGRLMLWAGTDGASTNQLYLIDPATGIATYQFDISSGLALTDGLAYENTGNGIIWHSPDVSASIEKFDAMSGASIGSLTPLDAGGAAVTNISGVFVGSDPILYVGRSGSGEIISVNKNTGAFISSFATPGGRDEGLECDEVSFGFEVLWSKDAFNDELTAIEVEPGTCVCGGAVPIERTSWGELKSRF